MSEIKQQENGYQGGAQPIRALTPGGHPQDTSQPAFPIYHRKFANPAPLGLFGFAATTFILSMYNVKARGVTVPNVVVGMAIGYGGIAQFLAGMWEFAAGNTFGATAFASYGAFWWSYAIIQIPWFGVAEGTYNRNGVPEAQLANAIGIYLAAWFIFTFIMLVASFRSSVGLVALFFFLDITFLLLFVAEFTGKSNIQTAGGAFGILTAAIAWYVGAAGLLTPDTSFFTLPVIELSRRD
ncbi:probable FUN34-transmembrane protein involved in ammonia production [Sporisorium reilianum SRZ2]|uniref:Probable FUN34-transmembrane protein involved in ammonia production n=1 Tax=Sporisorium reilianum (strain SRZ2) TaxID=999809 RepID=E6ZJT9_SPORE|nr:probable FUN34-transmembrane protein involved in ammonia production [Sporisorium reilianum SRZ2]